ncbi:30S ribosomal protein S20 [Candidatus Wolfebacteria bacterium RIFOXYD12_FULL_48_21]|nr:MAG: 30S ribosomal protein S20 [Candidatus Wolfebacteria bacterium RIFOXYD12_FULL_48_21]OGM97844.1 MAG: 30S ribosomal protein S20 [Candidatus Wolfebacteria bacterium RIFOXYD2_FULL_48_11]
MPNTKTAEKANRQNTRRKIRNVKQKDILKGSIKEYKKLVAGNQTEAAEKQLSTVFKKLDKAAKTNIIKKNKASRLKSRLSKKVSTPAK